MYKGEDKRRQGVSLNNLTQLINISVESSKAGF